MKKCYQTPCLELIEIEVESILCSSNGDGLDDVGDGGSAISLNLYTVCGER